MNSYLEADYDYEKKDVNLSRYDFYTDVINVIIPFMSKEIKKLKEKEIKFDDVGIIYSGEIINMHGTEVNNTTNGKIDKHNRKKRKI